VLLFPPGRSGEAALPLVLCGLWCFVLVFSWFSFRFLTGSFSSRRPVEWSCSGSCHRRRDGRIFIFSLTLMMPDLRSFVGFGETRAPQTCSSSSSGLTIPCIGRSGQRWPARVHHAPGFFLFAPAWWPRSVFSGCVGVATRAMWADLLQGVIWGWRVSYTRRFFGEDRVLCCRLVLNLLLDVFVHSCVALYGLSMYCTSFSGIFLYGELKCNSIKICVFT